MPQHDSASNQDSLAPLNSELKVHIRQKIKKNGSISFAEFMQMALYQPGLGYYSSGMHKFGQSGDFITSPELGSLFADCMAEQFLHILSKVNEPIIMELGAGTGQFCYDCLTKLDDLQALPDKYYILEVSADLQDRQKQLIGSLPERIQTLVEWIKQPPQHAFNGVIFANEVIDALSVEVFKKQQDTYQQMRVTYTDENFATTWQDFPQPLEKELISKNLNLPEGYISEFIPQLADWLQTISENLQQGLILFVDYGYEAQAYYHPQRHQGTLVCHHQHQANYDYFDRIGMQDITAFVDFTAVAEAADQCQLSVEGYTSQAHFLISMNIHEKLGDSESDYEQYYKKTTEMKKLTMPNEMGEKFKVMALSRNFDHELQGFSFTNQLHLL